MPDHDWDYIIIGSGFGGSVAALRLTEKGYRVLVLEMGRRLRPRDFPRTNWNLRRWFWLPALRFFGLFRLTFLRHQTVLSGVGVGGGSLVYSAVLEVPDRPFFEAASWSYLADWEAELAPHYRAAERMLGVTPNPRFEIGDRLLGEIAAEHGLGGEFRPTRLGIYFGEGGAEGQQGVEGAEVPDPYFDGAGPRRTGCSFCGGCMTGCRYGAKNSLDFNYLHLAEQGGAVVCAEAKVHDVQALDREDGSDGYEVRWRRTARPFAGTERATTRGVVFAAGALGTGPLLLRLRASSLPRLSARVGRSLRTNSESLMGIISLDPELSFSDGVGIGSILQTDPFSHLEPVRYASGSGFWRTLVFPIVEGRNLPVRLLRALGRLLRHPIRNLRALTVWDFARRAQILLYMRTVEGKLRFKRGRWRTRTCVDEGSAPKPLLPQARVYAERFAEKVDGVPLALVTEALLHRPTTAHLLGGAVMGRDGSEGVIDSDHRVFGYENLYVCDGSAISANPGVNPSLTITALTERAMSRIPARE